MKKISMKIATAALMIAVGTMGLSAQNGRGAGSMGNGTGTCINTSILTDEQKAELLELSAPFEAEMAALRAEILATTNIADKLALHKEMMALRDAHQAEVKALLESWGITVNMRGKKGNFGKRTSQAAPGSGVCTGTGTGVGLGNAYGRGK